MEWEAEAELAALGSVVILLTKYIEKLEAERDYYMGASDFAGVACNPLSKEVDNMFK